MNDFVFLGVNAVQIVQSDGKVNINRDECATLTANPAIGKDIGV